MSGDVVIVEWYDTVALVTLNRPEARNAMNRELAQATADAVTACQDAGAIVLTGADPAFCAGVDLKNPGVESLAELPRFTAPVRASKVPVVAAVNGPAVTGGLELALSCDLMIGSERATFADTHLKVGVFPGPVVVDLPRRVGMAWAREISLSGRFIDAGTALRIGLLNRLVPHDELLPAALALAAAMAGPDRDMVRQLRAIWDGTASLPIDEAHAAHQRLSADAGLRNVRTADLVVAGSRLLEAAGTRSQPDARTPTWRA